MIKSVGSKKGRIVLQCEELVKRGILIFDEDTKIYKAPLLGDEQVELREFREHLKP